MTDDRGWAAPDRTDPARETPPADPPALPTRITLPPHLTPPPPPPPAVRQPGGLFPSGPPRPVYREPAPVRGGPLAAGLGTAVLWMLLFGLLAHTARAYAWFTFGAGAAAWLAAFALGRFGDRGVAVGVAIGSALGVAIAGIAVTVQWAGGHWVLW